MNKNDTVIKQKVDAINRARKLLIEHPYDVYHTLEHHQSVYNNVLDIKTKEELLLSDFGTLEVAVWWHDVFKNNNKGEELISRELRGVGLEEVKIKRALSIIGGHSFGERQNSRETQLLYDADKLELVSIPRWFYAFDQAEAGYISKKERDKYIPEWNRRMPLLINKLNFPYSNRVFTERHKEFTDWLFSINRYKNGLFI